MLNPRELDSPTGHIERSADKLEVQDDEYKEDEDNNNGGGDNALLVHPTCVCTQYAATKRNK